MDASAHGSRSALFTTERNAETREQLLVIRSTMTAKATVPAHRCHPERKRWISPNMMDHRRWFGQSSSIARSFTPKAFGFWDDVMLSNSKRIVWQALPPARIEWFDRQQCLSCNCDTCQNCYLFVSGKFRTDSRFASSAALLFHEIARQLLFVIGH